MRKISFFIIVILTSLSLLLSACGADQAHTEAPVPNDPAEVAYEAGAWMNMSLTDARTGSQFKLSDHSGKVVILEMMDPGCPLCERQVKEIGSALEVVGDKAVAVSLDISIKGEEALVKWADRKGGTWIVAVMPNEFGKALISDFGSMIITPGDTPIIVIDSSGAAHVTDRGIKKSATLIELVNQWTQ